FHDGRRAIRHGLAHHHAADVAHECVRYRRPNAAADTRSADQQRVDGKHTKKYLEVGAKEYARPPLADDTIARLGRDLGDDRRALAAVDLDATLGVVALLVPPQTGRRAIAGNQALGVEHRQAPRAGTRAELPDRLISLADRRPQGRGCAGVTKIMLHVDHQHRGTLAEADALSHALLA